MWYILNVFLILVEPYAHVILASNYLPPSFCVVDGEWDLLLQINHLPFTEMEKAMRLISGVLSKESLHSLKRSWLDLVEWSHVFTDLGVLVNVDVPNYVVLEHGLKEILSLLDLIHFSLRIHMALKFELI